MAEDLARCPEIHPAEKVECREMLGENHEFHRGGERGRIRWPNEEWRDPTRRVVGNIDERMRDIWRNTEPESHAVPPKIDLTLLATKEERDLATRVWVEGCAAALRDFCKTHEVFLTCDLWEQGIVPWPGDGRRPMQALITRGMSALWCVQANHDNGEPRVKYVHFVVMPDGRKVPENKYMRYYRSLIFDRASQEISDRVLSNSP